MKRYSIILYIDGKECPFENLTYKNEFKECSHPTTLDWLSIIDLLMPARASTAGKSGKFPSSGFTDGTST